MYYLRYKKVEEVNSTKLNLTNIFLYSSRRIRCWTVRPGRPVPAQETAASSPQASSQPPLLSGPDDPKEGHSHAAKVHEAQEERRHGGSARTHG